MMASTSPYKPSPLSFGSPRSPFRRPETPTSPSTIRGSPQQSPTRSAQSIDPSPQPRPATSSVRPNYTQISSETRNDATQPGQQSRSVDTRGPSASSRSGDALSKLPASQVRELRDAFQTLDRNSDGQVGREDVSDILTNLGREPNAAPYFPPGASQTMSLPAYLTTLSSLLAPLSAPSELLSAFGAFDEDDSGQIDVEDLRDALLHTAPEPGSGGRPMSVKDIEQALEGFTGRRAFGKQQGLAKKGEVFRYHEFVANVSGANANGPVEVKNTKA